MFTNNLIYKIKYSLFFLGLIATSLGLSQNQTSKWYFGSYAGLDFLTNPPTILLNSVINIPEGCATTSDVSGNLLFYTNGETIYNSSHNVMANGSALNGSCTPTQSSIILKQPGNNPNYYIFTVQGQYSEFSTNRSS